MPRKSRLAPRKSPLQDRSAATVAAILEAAARVLERRGLDALTTNRVAEAAGVSIGSLYQYFPNKDAIVAALIRAAHESLRDDIVAVVADAAPFEDRLDRLIAAAVRHQLARPTLARILDVEEARLPVEPLTRAAIADMRHALVRVFSEQVAVNAIEQTIADVMAIARGLIDAAGQRGESDAPALRRRVFAAVMGYLKESGALTA